MKQVNLLLMSASMTLAACVVTKSAGQAGVPLIERSDIQIEGKRMTPEALWAMGRIGGVAVSPDEKQIDYSEYRHPSGVRFLQYDRRGGQGCGSGRQRH